MSPRPAPFVPLSVHFATGKTGTAILEHYGSEGLGVWAAMLAAADRGLIVFRHEDDWAAIGLGVGAPDFALVEFLTFLGRRKVTRKTRQGRVIYVQITQWEEWNNTKIRETARQQKARSRAKLKPDTKWMNGRPITEPKRTEPTAEAEAEADTERGLTSSRDEGKGPGFHIPTDLLREVS